MRHHRILTTVASLANLSAHALALNADAVAYAVYLYASGREAINLN